MSEGIGGGIIAVRECVMLIRVTPPSLSGSVPDDAAIMRCSHISPGSASHLWPYCLVVVGRLRLPYRPAVVGWGYCIVAWRFVSSSFALRIGRLQDVKLLTHIEICSAHSSIMNESK